MGLARPPDTGEPVLGPDAAATNLAPGTGAGTVYTRPPAASTGGFVKFSVQRRSGQWRHGACLIVATRRHRPRHMAADGALLCGDLTPG